MTERFSRRRFIRIAVGGAAMATLAGPSAMAGGASLRRWKGVALGAEAEMILPADKADRLIALATAEIGRLERIFSLYRADSALVRLNRQGFLETPPLELVDLLARAGAISAASGGAFDVTVQPLWETYAAHFARPGADPAGPPRAVLDAALERVDWQAVDVAPECIAFARPSMAVTLNGIAQGFITDRVAERFHAEGFSDVLLELGEIRALGRHPDGRPWRVRPSEGRPEIALSDGALATSAPGGTAFSAAGANHIFDPRNGRGAALHAWVSVAAPTATEADAWSTALTLMPAAAIRTAIKGTTIRQVWLPDAVIA